jgi:hypothetical protein
MCTKCSLSDTDEVKSVWSRHCGRESIGFGLWHHGLRTRETTTDTTNAMEHSYSWECNSRPRLLLSIKVHKNLPPVPFTKQMKTVHTLYTAFVTSISVLFYHLCIGLPQVLSFLQDLQPEFVTHFLSFPCVLHALSMSYLIYFVILIVGEYKLRGTSLSSFL